ncbi:MAG: DNA/RNA nuclease SfsA [Candidatus Hydrothermarchaeales archaeon]
MKIKGKLSKGVFYKRLNRYLALVKIDGKRVYCFVPNPGRMEELLVSGKLVVLKKVLKEDRKTSYDLIGVHHKNQIISIDSRIPNKLVFDALKNRKMIEFSGYNSIKMEPRYGNSRLDFLLYNDSEMCLLEVKSCTLVKDGRALFPDAPTERGRRHLMELIKAKKEGLRSCILFLIQRTDAKVFSPNDKTDPKFGMALREAEKEGVDIYAYSSEFKDNKIILKGKIRVDLRSDL